MGVKLLRRWFSKKLGKGYLLIHKETKMGYLPSGVHFAESFNSLEKLKKFRENYIAKSEWKNYYVYKRVEEGDKNGR